MVDDFIQTHFYTSKFLYCVDPLQYPFYQPATCLLAELSFIQFKFYALVDHGEYNTIYSLGSELFREVKDKGGFAGLRFVQEADMWVKPGFEYGVPYFAI